MNIYRQKTIWKFGLLLFAAGIGLFSFFYTFLLVKNSRRKKEKKN
jgi:cytochrome c oxidase assembly factor CtaG